MLITYKDSFHGNHFSALVSVDLLGYYSSATVKQELPFQLQFLHSKCI